MEVDYRGIESEICVLCIKCNLQKKTDLGIRGDKASGYFCTDFGRKCPFVVTSTRNGEAQSVAPSSKVFKKYGLRTLNEKSTYLYGKSHFFYYLYHPNMNWKPPELPEKNRFGDLVYENDIFTLEHRDGDHYNDSKDNLQFSLKSEHGVFEPNTLRKEPANLREAGIPKR